MGLQSGANVSFKQNFKWKRTFDSFGTFFANAESFHNFVLSKQLTQGILMRRTDGGRW